MCRTKQNLLEIENVTGSFVELVEEVKDFPDDRKMTHVLRIRKRTLALGYFGSGDADLNPWWTTGGRAGARAGARTRRVSGLAFSSIFRKLMLKH